MMRKLGHEDTKITTIRSKQLLMYVILQFLKYCFNRVDDQAEASSSKHAINDDNLTMEQIYRNKALHELTNQSILVLNLSISILTGKISTEEAYLHQKRVIMSTRKRKKYS